jgi:alpha-L-rhamnosidase
VATDSEGVEYVGYENGCQIYHLGSGTYSFTTSLKDAVSSVVGESAALPVYDLYGRLIRNDNPSVQGLRAGIYISGGKKVLTR